MEAKVYCGDCMDILPTMEAGSVQCCVTSPPYWGLRDYGVDGQAGLEPTPEEYLAKMVAVFRQVWRVLRNDGTLWLNMGDSYHNVDKGGYAKDRVTATDSMQRSNLGANFIGAPNRQPQKGLKPKDLCGIPWRLAFALQADGWYLRSDIIWHKPNPMPESVTDRPTKSHEYIFLLTKQERYFYDADAIREKSIDDIGISRGGSLARFGRDEDLVAANSHRGNKLPESNGFRNKRSVWTVATQPYREAHFATFPEDLIKPCIMAGSRIGDTVLDPFAGSGTTGMVAIELGRKAVMIELNPKYCEMIEDRTNVTAGML